MQAWFSTARGSTASGSGVSQSKGSSAGELDFFQKSRRNLSSSAFGGCVFFRRAEKKNYCIARMGVLVSLLHVRFLSPLGEISNAEVTRKGLINSMKTPYETMFLLPTTVTGEQVDELIDRLKKAVEKKYGEVYNVEKMGVRKTAYEVNKHNSAFYVLIQYRGNGETLNEMERTLKNADEVLKFLSTKITTKATPPAKPAAAETPAPAAATEVAVATEPSAEETRG